MATRAQIKANRNNAKKSTGPRSEEGKARVAKNALQHGLLARDTVLPGEDPPTSTANSPPSKPTPAGPDLRIMIVSPGSLPWLFQPSVWVSTGF